MASASTFRPIAMIRVMDSLTGVEKTQTVPDSILKQLGGGKKVLAYIIERGGLFGMSKQDITKEQLQDAVISLGSSAQVLSSKSGKSWIVPCGVEVLNDLAE